MRLRRAGLEAVCDSLQDSLFLVDEARTIIEANPRLREVTGRSEGELVGYHVSTLDAFVDDGSFSAFADAVGDVLAGRAVERRLESTVTSPTEGTVVVDARITPFSADADMRGAVVVLRDVTDRTERERALTERSEQLAIINRVLRHDIRNDVAVMLGWAAQLDELVGEADERDALDRIVEHGQYVVELTKEARDLVDAVESDWELPLEPIDVGRTLGREVETAREQFPSATLSMPEGTPDVTVMANEFLGSVFGNLLRNAIVHNDRDTPRVTITWERTPDSVRVAIADDGPGIPDARKATLFEKGEKGPDSPGTGIGLYLVQSLVSAYDGSVTVTDDDPRGSVFTVTLPASPSA